MEGNVSDAKISLHKLVMSNDVSGVEALLREGNGKIYVIIIQFNVFTRAYILIYR